MQYRLSEKEKQIIEHEFVYLGRNDGIIGGYCEDDFPIYYANQEIASMLGYENVSELVEGIDGKVSNTIHPDDMPQVMQDLGGGAFYEGMSYESTYRMKRKDGSWFWTVDKGKVVKAEDGRLAIISLCTDMTDFVKRKNELEQEHIASESMMNNLPGGYHRCSAEEGFPFLYISDRFVDILGWTREEIAEKFDNKFANMVHPDDYSLMTGYAEQILPPTNRKSFFDQLYRMLGKDGYHWVSDSTLMVEINGEKVYQGSITDVTEFMEEREKREKDLKKADEMKSRFLSAISHDIRTPVNGIQGMLRIADEYSEDMIKQKECREKMWIASNHLVSLVNNVLDMKRLENTEIELKEEPFNLIDLLMGINAMTDMQIEAKGLHSIVDWKPGYIKHRYLIGSAEGFSRVLLNLNSNAIKYNKKGGSIYCRCMEKECDGDIVWFETITSDTGVGMDEEFLKHAFEPYTQKNNTSIGSQNGVGLGLSIVKKTVEMMGGKLKVESKVGEGTKYTILFPFKIDPNPNQEKKSLEEVKLDKVNVLLVEDNDLNQEIAKFHLEQHKMNVYTVMNGQEAVEVFKKSEVGFYDIILMDIMMPVMDGLEATKYIRGLSRPDAIAVPIVAMSANAFKEDIQKSLDAGMNAHLIKPLDVDKMIDTIKNYLGNKLLEPEYERFEKNR